MVRNGLAHLPPVADAGVSAGEVDGVGRVFSAADGKLAAVVAKTGRKSGRGKFDVRRAVDIANIGHLHRHVDRRGQGSGDG